MKLRLATLTFALAYAAYAQDGNRIALIIGNDSYGVRPLQNAVNDARAMDKALRDSGFRTILRENATKVMLESAAAEFVQAIGPNDTALFFYAGHAVQIENENVLIPVDFEASRSVVEARFKSFSLALVFEYLKTRGKTKIVIVDACRSNPAAEGNSLQAGLAIPQNAGKNTYIAYSTSPNRVAQDNPDGKNSWFTEALADAIAQRDLTLEDVFTRVRLRVENATQGSQTPWSQTSLTSKFYFHPPDNIQETTEADLSEKWLADARRDAKHGNWQDALEGLNRILKTPGTPLAVQVRAMLPYVQTRLDAESKFEARDYAGAATLFDKAVAIDPFAVEAAFASANSHLLAEDIGAAIQSLNDVRARGTSADAGRADAFLKELAVVQPEAAEALKKGLPPPPPIREVLTGAGIGLPDWKAGMRRTRQTPMDYNAFAAQMPLMALPVPEPMTDPPPAPIEPNAASQNTVTLDTFHVEVKTEVASRDLVQEADFGELNLSSSRAGTSVLVDGRTNGKLPLKLRVAPGKYQIRVIEQGKTLQTKEVEVKSNGSVELVF